MDCLIKLDWTFFIILCWSIGIVFSIIAIYLNNIVIPRIEGEIHSFELKQNWFNLTNQQMASNEMMGSHLQKFLILMQGVGFQETDPRFSNIISEILLIQRQTLIILNSDNPPSLGLLERWNQMGFDELNKEKIQYLAKFSDLGNKFAQERLLYQKKRDKYSPVALSLNISSIILIQLGIILQLIWSI